MQAQRFRLIAIALLFISTLSFSQNDPRQVLGGVIAQLQTGRPNPAWYGQQLWQTIAFQTNNSGVYPQLVSLGPVNNVVINQTQQLPGGILYAMTASHQNGTSSWYFGIAANRVEYANFTIGAFPATTNADPLPKPPPGKKSEDPGPQSESCRKFPNLCP